MMGFTTWGEAPPKVQVSADSRPVVMPAQAGIQVLSWILSGGMVK